MVETRRSSVSSSSTKRPLSSPSPPPSPSQNKRSKPAEESSLPRNDRLDLNESPAAPQLGPADPSPGSAPEVSPPGGCSEGEVAGLMPPPPPPPAAADIEREQSAGKSREDNAWGKLISQSSQNDHLLLCSSLFTVGQSRNCNLRLRDALISSILCKLRYTEHGGATITLLEISGSKGIVQVNGSIKEKGSNVILMGGDEIVFSSPGKHAYIFQQLTNDKLKTAVLPPSLALPDTQGPCIEGIHFQTRSGDPSADDGASILASLSNIGNDLSVLPLVSSNGENGQQGLDMSILPSTCDASDSCPPDLDINCHVKGNPEHANEHTRFTSGNKSTDLTGSENLHCSSSNLDACLDREAGNISGSSYELRPLVQVLEGPSTSGLDLSENALKRCKGHMELRKNLDPPAALPIGRSQALKDGLKQGILSASDIQVSFDNFPYYLSENTKNVLISCARIHMEFKEFTKFTAEISSMNQRMLLSGPAGSEIYQETLIKALAKHFGVRLLIINLIMFPGLPSIKDSESVKDCGRTEKLGTIAKQRAALANAVQLRRPTPSVEANIGGASTINSHSWPKLESSASSSSKNHTFKEGDRVKFVGLYSRFYLPPPQRGPSYGYRGKVVLAFEENNISKVGVRFDKQIPEGNDLGGRCEKENGFFVNADLLRLDSFGGEDVEQLAINELLEVVCEESKSGSLIVLLKDIEKSLSGSSDSYQSFKNKIELIPAGVLLIGSLTQMDCRKEKSHPGGLLFTKFGSNQTALLDLTLPDTIGRLHDKSKELPKTMKHLTKLFPNKVSIQIPQDEAQLVDWKQLLDRDVETLKAKCNMLSIRSFLTRNGLECSDIEAICLKDQTLTSETVDKIVGFALSHHLNHSTIEASAKDVKLVLSSDNSSK